MALPSTVSAQLDSPDIDACLAAYKPLSNLPTPPPQTYDDLPSGQLCCHDCSSVPKLRISPSAPTSRYHSLAAHLIASLPSNLSNYSPSTATVTSYLERAAACDPVVGLAICIVETLSGRFARCWRQSSFYAGVRHDRAEVVVVAALAVASAFLDDWRREARWWSDNVTARSFSARQINVATRCVLADIDYDLHAFTPDTIAEALEDARRGGEETLVTSTHVGSDSEMPSQSDAMEDEAQEQYSSCKIVRRDSGFDGGGTLRQGGSNGVAVWSHGELTPEPSPLEAPMLFLRLL